MLLRAAKRSVVTKKGCWEFPGKRPYPTLFDRCIRLAVHHLAFRVWHGVPQQQVLHTCDNSRCWNPAHLYDGDSLQNNTDRRSRYKTYGRSGAANHFSKLTAEQAAEIVSARAVEGVLRRKVALEFAERFGIGVNHVYRIAVGRSWRTDTRTEPEPLPLWHQRGVKLSD